jgi:hypothetical protein
MRFVPVTTLEQQSILMAHRARSMLVRQRHAGQRFTDDGNLA